MQESVDADVLVDLRPVNTLAIPQELPVLSLGVACMEQSREPRKRNYKATPINEGHDQFIFSRGDVVSARF